MRRFHTNPKVQKMAYMHFGYCTLCNLFFFQILAKITLVPEVFLDFSSRKRSRASREAATTSRESDEEREKPLVTLASNLTFMQTTAVKRVKLLIKRVTNGHSANTCLSAAIFLSGGRPGEIML